jgi:glucan phosphorylase
MRNCKPEDYYGSALKRVFDVISEGMFGYKEELTSLIDTLRYNNDFYLVCHDFYSYCDAQEKVFS